MHHYFFVHTAFDYEAVNKTIYDLTGGFSPSLMLDAYQDGEAEQLEGFVIYLEIVESELDPRDVGNVSLSRSVYLIRINQSGTTMILVIRFNIITANLMFMLSCNVA